MSSVNYLIISIYGYLSINGYISKYLWLYIVRFVANPDYVGLQRWLVCDMRIW